MKALVAMNILKKSPRLYTVVQHYTTTARLAFPCHVPRRVEFGDTTLHTEKRKFDRDSRSSD